MNNTVAIASARHAPSTAPSDDVSTNNKVAMETKPKLNPQSLAQRAAAPVPVPPPKSPDAPAAKHHPQQPESNPSARANAIAKSQKSRRRFQRPDKCSAKTTPQGSARASAARHTLRYRTAAQMRPKSHRRCRPSKPGRQS